MVVLAFLVGLFVGAGAMMWIIGVYVFATDRSVKPRDEMPQYTDWQGMSKFSSNEVPSMIVPCCDPGVCSLCDSLRPAHPVKPVSKTSQISVW